MMASTVYETEISICAPLKCVLLYGQLPEQERWIKTCAVIGYPSGWRWSYLARSGLPAVSRRNFFFPKSHIVNPLLTKPVRPFFASLWTSTSSRSINTQKRTWSTSSHLDTWNWSVTRMYWSLNNLSLWAPQHWKKRSIPPAPRVHTSSKKFENVVLFLWLMVSILENCSSNRRNLKTPLLCFSVEGTRFENRVKTLR